MERYSYEPTLYLFWKNGRLHFLYWGGDGFYAKKHYWGHDYIYCVGRDPHGVDRARERAEKSCAEFLGWHQHWDTILENTKVLLSAAQLADLLLFLRGEEEGEKEQN